MKRVPLNVSFFAGGLRVLARFLFKSEEPNLVSFIEAVVDTGSPRTVIGSKDIAKMRLSKIQINKLEGRQRPIKLGDII